MKTELQRLKTILGLLVALALAIPLVMAVPALAQPPSLAGNVENDFAGPSILIVPDPIGDVGLPTDAPVPPPGTVSGWDMKDLRLFYDATTDTMYIGINVGDSSSTILGDSDGDGNPGGTSAWLAGHGGMDLANLDLVESAGVYFDLNQDGTWDVIAGISAATDYYGFSVNVFTGAFFPPGNFGTALPTHIGNISPNPDLAHPDLEFTITNWSTLPGDLGLTDTSAGFKVGACLGAYPIDDGIGEDLLEGSFSPAINIVKKTNGTDNNWAPGPYIAVNGAVTWTYDVTNPGSENLTNIVLTDDKGTPGNTGDDFNPSPVDVSPADGFNDGDTDKDNELDLTETWLYQATGSATVGQYSNTATATGYFGSIPVSDTDPDNYLGVKARIAISPLLDSNRVGEEHVLTACVYVDTGTGYAPYTQPITINFSNVGVGNLSVTTVATMTGCAQTTLTSDVVGNSTVSAQCAFTVGGVSGVSFNIATDGTGDNSGPAKKIWGVQACIHIEKTTNGKDANSGPGPYIPVGDPVTWVYNVTNCGDVPLSSINVTDDKGTPGNTGDDFKPSPVDVSPADGFNDGDTDKDNELDLNEIWLCQATGFATVGQYSNTATVTGYFGGIPVSDTDPDNYLGVRARIEIGPLLDSNRVGEEHVLTACVYVDTGSGYALYTQPITINFSRIGVGSLSVVSVPTATGCAQTILTSSVTGNSTVTAQCLFTVGGAGGASFNISTDGTGDNSGSAKKTWVAQACIHIEKTTNGIDGPLIAAGDPVIWVYNVTNCGDVPLSSINVTDSDPGVIPAYVGGDDNSNTFLDLTEAWIYQATGTAAAGYYANIGYVTAKTPEQNLVSYTDPSNYYNRPTTVGWETYPVNKLRLLIPWIALLGAITAGASLLVLRRRQS